MICEDANNFCTWLRTSFSLFFAGKRTHAHFFIQRIADGCFRKLCRNSFLYILHFIFRNKYPADSGTFLSSLYRHFSFYLFNKKIPFRHSRRYITAKHNAIQ